LVYNWYGIIFEDIKFQLEQARIIEIDYRLIE